MKIANSRLMGARSLFCAPGARLLALGLISAALVLVAARNTSGQTIMGGEVLNSISKVPVPGVIVKIFKGDHEIGKGSSNTEGNFRVAVEIPVSSQPQNVNLVAEHPDFATVSLTTQVTSGKPAQDFYRLALLQKELTHCLTTKKRCVIVGHFLAPATATQQELSLKITQALNYNVLPKLQQHRLKPESQPTFWECKEAHPRALELGKQYAEGLKADAFVFGDVKQGDRGFNVNIFVCDAHGLYESPLRFKNQNVDLDDPAAAQMQPETNVAIIAAIARGYEKEGKFAEGFIATQVAEQILGVLKPEIKEIRERCQRQMPHQGLLTGGGR